MGASGRVRILALDELECVHELLSEAVVQRQPVVFAQRNVVATACNIVVDHLRRVGIVGARVNVGPVGGFIRVGVKDPGDHCSQVGIGRERDPLLGQRHQHVAIDVAPVSLLAEVNRQ